jgi:hypothetical protein
MAGALIYMATMWRSTSMYQHVAIHTSYLKFFKHF